jgi:hypothetical protein
VDLSVSILRPPARNGPRLIVRDGLPSFSRTTAARRLQGSVRPATPPPELSTQRRRSTRSIEEALGRKVIAYMSQIHADPDLAVGLFVLEPHEADQSE